MLSIIKDGPFRYIHSAATGELIITLLIEHDGRFVDYDAVEPVRRTLHEWKVIARRRLGDVLITDTDNRN